MGLLAVLLSIAGYVLLLGRFTRWPPAALPAVVVSSMVLALYASALVGALKPGAWIIFSGGLGALVATMVPLRAGLAAARRTAADPGIAILVVCALLFWIRMHNAAYHNWDEFSHWGVVTKEILRLDGLPISSSPLMFLSYPPGAALFQYYFALFAGYSEGLTIFAQAIVTLSMLALLLQGLDWSRPVAIVATSLAGVLLVLVLGNGLKNILIDHLVGVCFGGAIAMYIVAPGRDLGAAARALPIIMMLPLLKAVGMFLAVIAGATIFLMMLRDWRPVLSMRRSAPWALAGLALFIAPYLVNKTWSVHVRDARFVEVFDQQKFSALDLVRTLQKENRTDRENKIISSFLAASWQHTVQKSGWSATVWIIVLAAAFLIAYWRAPGPTLRARILICSAAMSVGLALYGGGMLMLYLYNFSDYAATRSLQFGRYASIYLLGWAWVAVALLRSMPGRPAGLGMRVVAFAAGSIALVALIGIAPIPSIEQSRPPERAEIRQQALEITRRVPADKSVFIIWQNSKGFQYWVLRSELVPRRVNPDCWAIGTPADADDLWTCNWAPPEIARNLASFDYVLVAKGDKPLEDVLAPFVQGGNVGASWTLYAAEKTETGGIRLRPLPTSASSR